MSLLTLTTRPFAQPHRPAMANREDPHSRIGLTSAYVTRDGRPWIPVSGEMHFSRMPRHRWAERLAFARAGGISVVSSYVFWNHHEPVRGQISFAGNLDIAAFVRLAADAGLWVVLRPGPWVHAESRNGGIPDWVVAAGPTRQDDPGYLAQVRRWFAALAAQLDGLLGPDSPVIALQMDNELYGNPEHLTSLKRIAREVGLVAPIWTGTAWGSAALPTDQLLPQFGGYGDGFWVDSVAGWHPSFRAHYAFSDQWDDPGIGDDVRIALGDEAPEPGPLVEPSPDYPIVTCELGAGMATAYHRRPAPQAKDVAGIALSKIGSGSAWQGYYMYAGGTNPNGIGPIQESHETGYPNDVERHGYDFHAPLGEAGQLRESHALLRLQNAFLAATGERMAEMAPALPDQRPVDVYDSQTLRWAVRSAGQSGFCFINWHQPHEPLATYPAAQFSIDLGSARLTLPDVPVAIPAGTQAWWPFGYQIGQVTLSWATASLVTELASPAGPPAAVLLASAGIECRLAVPAGTRLVGPGLERVSSDGQHDVFTWVGADAEVIEIGADGGRLILLPADLATQVWVLDRPSGPELLLSQADLRIDEEGRLAVRSLAPAVRVRRYDQRAGAFVEVTLEAADDAAVARDLAVRLIRPAGQVPAEGYGQIGPGRASAPSEETIQRLGARYEIGLGPDVPVDGLLDIDWEGDVAIIETESGIVNDDFWDGTIWRLNPADLGLWGQVKLSVLPLRADAPVWVPEAAQARRDQTGDTLCAVRSVRLSSYQNWREAL